MSDIHHAHAWSLTGKKAMITLHATVADGADGQDVLTACVSTLQQRFGIEHATVQIEKGPCGSPIEEECKK